ncbi:helix-turn-helix transcriptional regulator [Paenibacillus sp. FSL R7-0312]
MHSHYTDSSITVRKLAEMSHMSEVYFRKLFKETFSISP